MMTQIVSRILGTIMVVSVAVGYATVLMKFAGIAV
jgi:hypothetical protein